ncbi:MAG: ring-cleaving dioxygenase [Beijerinckiaceae bacterium]
MLHPGIHHITAIAGDPRANVAFYTGQLGLRLVKKTVNFDDPGTYHLYYGDEAGSPGTILTFFPWANVPKGKAGAGEVTRIDFQAPAAAHDFWAARLSAIRTSATDTSVFGERVIDFQDPDGMALRLVFTNTPSETRPWAAEDISAAHALHGFHAAAMTVANPAATQAIISDVIGLTARRENQGIIRLATGQPGIGMAVELIPASGAPRGQPGAGSVHHIAFRADSDLTQEKMASALAEQFRLGATEQKDRNYFRSIYFREPSGVLFEIATDDPGFAIDEAPETLGMALKLPPQYEQHRAAIEAVLPDLS